MISELQGKKLVILGGAANESTLVKRAQELGIYVIVADYYTDIRLSPAKAYADEAWDVNWTDVDTMVQMCKDNNVDGVTAGYSEVKIDFLIQICDKLGLPCYCTTEQLELTRDKAKFKEQCLRCNVPIVKEYPAIELVEKYPVIVKPTDCAGSIGISIAHNKKELEKAYEYALECSLNKRVIIEEYITHPKIDIYYLVDNGEVSVLTTNDVIMANNNDNNRVVQSGWLYPHKYEDNLLKKVDSSLKTMIKDMGIKYGCIFFSGFIDENRDYTFFECGFRLEGAHQYNYTCNKGNVNFLDVFISHALTGNLDAVKKYKKVNEELKLAIANIYAKSGVIAEISGVSEIEEMEDCCLALVKSNIGDKCKDDTAILTKVAMFEFNNINSECLANDIKKMYQKFKIVDINGKDMNYDIIDTNMIRNWWS